MRANILSTSHHNEGVVDLNSPHHLTSHITTTSGTVQPQPDTGVDVVAEVEEGETVLMAEPSEVVLEVVHHTHDGTVVTGVAVRIQGLQADVTQCHFRLRAILHGVRDGHVLQVRLNLVQLHTTKTSDLLSQLNPRPAIPHNSPPE